eukprot:6403872-Prymnesium_polylepis.1
MPCKNLCCAHEQCGLSSTDPQLVRWYAWYAAVGMKAHGTWPMTNTHGTLQIVWSWWVWVCAVLCERTEYYYD